jgi:hypothetical protein
MLVEVECCTLDIDIEAALRVEVQVPCLDKDICGCLDFSPALTAISQLIQ